MSEIATLTFRVHAHHDAWREIVEGLCRGDIGANLQDRMDVFGEAVADRLEALLESDDHTLLLGESCEIEGDRITIEFQEWPPGERRFPEALGALLELCGATDVSFSYTSLAGD